MPQELKNLIRLAYLRNLAGHFGVTKIRVNKFENIVFLDKKEEIIDKRLASILSDYQGKLVFDSTVKIKFDGAGGVQEKLEKLIKFFEEALKEN